MYTRTFDAEGVPHAVEAEYGQQLGYGPTIFWAGDKFLTAYCVMYDWANLGYTLMFTAFNEVGQKLAAEYPLRNEQGTVMLGRMALGVDLQFTSGAKLLFGKAQTSDAWGLSATPFVFALNGDAVIAPTLTLTRVGDKIQLAWPAEAEGFTLQQTLDLNSSQWTVVPDVTDLQNGQRFVTLPMIGARFFRLVQ
jgi:hypothetical protein